MTENKSFSSQEIESLVNHWQYCEFVNMKTMDTIVSIPHFDLYLPGSRFHCNPKALEKIKTALTQAYEQGIRDVGLFAPPDLSMEIVYAGLSITDDRDWQIFPLWEPTYLQNSLITQEKIFNQALVFEQMDLELQEVEKDLCAKLGFTEEVLLELVQNRDAKSVQELPPHLRELFSDGQEEIFNLEQNPPNQQPT